MALQTIQGGLVIPKDEDKFGTTPTIATFVFNDSNDAVAWIFQIPKSGFIRYIQFMTGTVTTGDTVKAGIYNLDATTGAPNTASAYGSMVAGTLVVNNTDDSVPLTVTLGTDATATAGDIVCAVLEFNSYVAGNMVINYGIASGPAQNFPHTYTFETAWSNTNANLLLGIKYSDGTYGYIPSSYPWSATPTSQTFQTTTSPDEYALRFSLPFPCRVSGVVANAVSVADMEFRIYDSDGTTQLAAKAIDKDYFYSTSRASIQIIFPTPATLLANTVYRAAMIPTAAGANATLIILNYTEAAALNQLPGGTNFYLSSRTDAGAWTDDATKRPMIGLIIDQLDDGTGSAPGSSGMLVHPGMQGGCRG